MTEYFLLIPLLLVAIAMLIQADVFSKVVKYIGFGYFFVLTLVFIIVRERISYLYEHPPIPDIYWDKNSNWADMGMFLYLVPTAVIFLILCFSWFKREKKLKERILIFLFFVTGLILIFGYAFFFSLGFGYRP